MEQCYEAPSKTEEYTKMLAGTVMDTDFQKLDEIAEFLLKNKESAKVFLAGNGGSAATASHFANDLTKGVRVADRPGFSTQCLNDANAVVTCLANDFDYADIYSIMLETYAKKGDILIVFSGSGNSPNIINALVKARDMGVHTIGFGGRDGGKMKDLCDDILIAPTYSMEQLEDMHIIYVHALVCRLKELLSEK